MKNELIDNVRKEIMNFDIIEKNPLLRFPQGGNTFNLLPPWGKAGMGVIILLNFINF